MKGQILKSCLTRHRLAILRTEKSENGFHSPASRKHTTAVPTDTPQPTPTDTPQPTATPQPSWHTIGTYSGNTPETVTAFTTDHPWRVQVTCTPGTNDTEAFSFSYLSDGAAFAGGGNVCIAPNTGFTFTVCPIDNQGDVPCEGSHTYTVESTSTGNTPMCAWTATIEEWY